MELDPNDLRKLIEEMSALNRNISSSGTLLDQAGRANAAISKKSSDDFDRSTRAIINALGMLGTRIEGLRTETKISARDRRSENQKIEDFTASVQKTTSAQIEAAAATQEREAAERAAEEATRKRIAAEEEASRISRMTARERQEYERAQKAAERDQKKEAQKKEAEENRKLLQDSLKHGNLRYEVSKKGLLEAQNTGSKVWEQMSSLGNSTDFVQNQLKDGFAGFITQMGGGTRSLIAFDGATKVAGAALTGLTKGVTSYASALYKGERGFSVGARAFSEAIKPFVELADMVGNIVSFASIFVPGGLLVKGAVALGGQLIKLGARAAEAAAKLNELQAEQLDKTFKAFREISTVGASTAGGLEDVFDSMQKLGLTTAEIEEFTKVITSNSDKLARMGAGVAEGRKAFQDVTNTLIKSGLGYELERLGMTTKEQTRITMSYMSVQARLGTLQGKSVEQLAKESAKYAKELDSLARLTGMSREEAEREREKALEDDRFRAAMDKAREEGDVEFEKQLTVARDIAIMLEKAGMAEEARGVRALAASKGAPTTEESAKVYRQGYAEAIQTGDLGQALGVLSKTLPEFSKQFRDLTTVAPQTDLLSYAKNQDFIKVFADAQARAEAEGKGRTALDIIDEDREKQRREVSKRTEAAIGLEREQKEMAQKLDSAAFQLLDVAQMHRDAAANLNKAADTLIKWTGTKSADIAGGGWSKGGGGAGGGAAAAPGSASVGAQGFTSTGGGAAIGYRTGGRGARGTTGAAGTQVVQPVASQPGGAGDVSSLLPQSSMGAASTGMMPKPEQAPQLQAIREMIASVESRGNYNVIVGGKTAPLTTMTIAEVLEMQRGLIREKQNSAAGKYQVKFSTLSEIAGKAGLSLEDKFDEANQDKIADALIMRRGFAQYARNPTSQGKERFLANLAAEWAGLPAGPQNESYYKGVGDNKSHITWNAALAAFADGGIVKQPTISLLGERPGSQEAVIPLKNGFVPVTLNIEELMNKMAIKQVDISNGTNQILESTMSKIAENARNSGVSSETITQLTTEFQSMNDKLAQVLDVLGSSRDIQSSLLSYNMS